MDDTGAEIIDHYWAFIKEKTFRTTYAQKQFSKLNTLKPLSLFLLSEYKGYQYDVDMNKDRLIFSNKFRFLEDRPGEYILLSKHFLEIFSTKRVKTGSGYVASLKMLPCFWINNEIITVLKFYLTEEKAYFAREEINRGDKIGAFGKTEFSSLNFIEVRESISEKNTIDTQFLSQSGMKQYTLINKYLAYNLWIMPEVSIVDVSPNCFFLFSKTKLIPVIPYRVILIVDSIPEDEENISILGDDQSLYKKFRVSYLDSLLQLKTEIIYASSQVCESQHISKGDMYNCLIFTFLDFYQEKTYPVLFEIYKKDITAMDIIKESILFWFKERFFRSKNTLSISIEKPEMVTEVLRFVGDICNRLRIDFNIAQADKENIINTLLAELAPVIMCERGRIFKMPLLLSTLDVSIEILKSNLQEIERIIVSEASRLEKGIAMQSLINKVQHNKTMGLSDAECLVESMEQWLVFIDYKKSVSSKISE